MNHVDLPGCDDFLVHRMSLAEQLIRCRGLVVLFVAGLQLVAWPFLCMHAWICLKCVHPMPLLLSAASKRYRHHKPEKMQKVQGLRPKTALSKQHG